MERFAFQYFEKKGKWRYKKLREPKIWKFRQKVLRQERPLEGYVFVAVDETGEDVMSDEICRRNNGKQKRMRGGRSVQLPDWVLNKIKRQHICLLYTSPSPRDLSTSRMPSSA